MIDRVVPEACDASNLPGGFCHLFTLLTGVVSLDGNSPGALWREMPARAAEGIERGWGKALNTPGRIGHAARVDTVDASLWRAPGFQQQQGLA